MTKPPLTKQKRKWVAKRKVTLRGTGLNYNASQQAKYKDALNKLVKQMAEEANKQIQRLFNGEIADDYFDQQKEAAVMDASIASKAKKFMNALTAKKFSFSGDQDHGLTQCIIQHNFSLDPSCCSLLQQGDCDYICDSGILIPGGTNCGCKCSS